MLVFGHLPSFACSPPSDHPPRQRCHKRYRHRETERNEFYNHDQAEWRFPIRANVYFGYMGRSHPVGMRLDLPVLLLGRSSEDNE